ncbi:MAG: hypothetical protein ABI333_17955 [bacterium]
MRKAPKVALLLLACGGATACGKVKKSGAEQPDPAITMDATKGSVVPARTAPRARPRPLTATVPAKGIQWFPKPTAEARKDFTVLLDVLEALSKKSETPLKRASALRRTAWMMGQLGFQKRGIALAKKALREFDGPNMPEPLIRIMPNFAITLAILGDTEAARGAAANALKKWNAKKREGDTDRFVQTLIVVHARTGDYDGAAKFYARLPPAEAKRFREAIPRNAALRGDFDEAFRRAAELPAHEGVIIMIGIVEEALRRRDEKNLRAALSGVKKLFTQAQTNIVVVGALIRYVELACRAGMRAEALAKAEFAKSAFKDAPSFRQGFLRDLAASLGRGGMKAEARKLLEELAGALKPEEVGTPIDLHHLAIAAAKAGLAPLARSLYARAKQSAVQWEKMLNRAILFPSMVVDLHLQLGELEPALKELAKLKVGDQVYQLIELGRILHRHPRRLKPAELAALRSLAK